MLAMDSSNLYMIFVSDGLVEFWVGHQLWKVDMHGSSESSSEVSWAVRDVTEMLVVSEFSFLLNLTSCDRESLEDFLDV